MRRKAVFIGAAIFGSGDVDSVPEEEWREGSCDRRTGISMVAIGRKEGALRTQITGRNKDENAAPDSEALPSKREWLDAHLVRIQSHGGSLLQANNWDGASVVMKGRYGIDADKGRPVRIYNLHAKLRDGTIVRVDSGALVFDPSSKKHYSVRDYGSRPYYLDDGCVHYFRKGLWINRRHIDENFNIVQDSESDREAAQKYFRDMKVDRHLGELVERSDLSQSGKWISTGSETNLISTKR